MTISVIIPAYNAEKWIAGTIENIRSQVPMPAEIIIVDDGSSDSTAEIVRSSGGTVQLITKSNEGASIARNTGLEIVTSPYVYFLDADDYVENNFLAGAVNSLEKNKADIAFGPVISEKDGGRRLRTFHYETVPEPSDVFENWLDHYSQPPCSVVWRTNFIRRIGGWSPEMTLNDDGELMMRAMLFKPRLSHFLDGHGVYREHAFPSLSKLRSSDAISRELRGMLSLMSLARQLDPKLNFSGFGRRLYIIARGLFECDDIKLGRLALSEARKVGFDNHVGSPLHRVFCLLLGLQLKCKIARFVKRIKYQFIKFN